MHHTTHFRFNLNIVPFYETFKIVVTQRQKEPFKTSFFSNFHMDKSVSEKNKTLLNVTDIITCLPHKVCKEDLDVNYK